MDINSSFVFDEAFVLDEFNEIRIIFKNDHSSCFFSIDGNKHELIFCFFQDSKTNESYFLEENDATHLFSTLLKKDRLKIVQYGIDVSKILKNNK